MITPTSAYKLPPGTRLRPETEQWGLRERVEKLLVAGLACIAVGGTAAIGTSNYYAKQLDKQYKSLGNPPLPLKSEYQLSSYSVKQLEKRKEQESVGFWR